MSEPRWITKAQVIRMHAEQLAVFGGPAGLRDEGMLESALGRPQNKWAFGETDYAALAAAYAFGIARNHPFVDGNKRVAFVLARVFLGLNGVRFDPPEAEAVVMVEGLAGSAVRDADFVAWLRKHSK